MPNETRVVTKPKDYLQFNWQDSDDNRVMSGALLERCREIECRPNGLFFTYPAGRSQPMKVKADLDVVLSLIQSGQPVSLWLEEKDDELWLAIALTSREAIESMEAMRAERLVYHLTQAVLEREKRT